jgi:hypothetical protein
LAVRFHIVCVESGLDWIVGDLNQLRIIEPLRTGKLENSKINGGFQHKLDTNAICFRIHLYAHFIAAGCGLQRSCGLADLIV